MEALTRFYTKNGLAAQKIAQTLLAVREGERIPRIDDFVRNLKLGRGTIQGSLTLLEDVGAVRVESRGHLGTFLIEKDNAALWKIAGHSTIIGVMPLPYSRKYEGLATGFVEVFQNGEIPFNMAFMRGAENRINSLLHSNVNFAIVSHWAAQSACRYHSDLHIFKTFGKETYVKRHGILFADKSKTKIEDGMHVGVDYTSIDQQKLTLFECKNLNVQLVNVNYMQMFQYLKGGKIDAAVWNLDETHLHTELGVNELQSEQSRKLADMFSEAALLINHKSHVMQMIGDVLGDEIIDIQQLVEQGKKIPHY